VSGNNSKISFRDLDILVYTENLSNVHDKGRRALSALIPSYVIEVLEAKKDVCRDLPHLSLQRVRIARNAERCTS